MRLTRADRWIAALIMTALAVMSLCFAQRSTNMAPLPPLLRIPSSAVEVIAVGDRVDVNTAGLDELMSLPGIGEARARAILDDRAANGPYRYPEDLIRVKGIGEGILSELLDQITAGGK